MRKFLLFAALAVAAVGCNKDFENDNTTPEVEDDSSIQLSVAISASEYNDSRVAFTDDTDENGGSIYTVTWKEGDELGAWIDGSNAFYNDAFDKFEISEGGFDAVESTFEGTLSMGTFASSVRFVHPYTSTEIYAKNNIYYNKMSPCNAFNVSLANQTATTDLSNLNENTYMMSQPIEIEGTNNSITQTPAMCHLGALLDINVVCTEAAANNYELVEVNVACATMPSEVSVNMQKDFPTDDGDFSTYDYFEATAHDGITVAVPNFTADSDGVFPTVPLNIFPFEFSGASDIVVTITFTDAAATNYYTAVKTISTGGAYMLFERATRNIIKATVSDLVSKYTSTTILPTDLSSGSYGDYDDNGDVEIGGVDFFIQNCYQQTMYNAIQMQGVTDGCIYNTSPLIGLNTVTVDVFSGYTIHVYAGTSEGPTTEISGVNGVYTIPSGYEYFKVGAVTDYARVASISMTYESVREPVAVLYGLSESAFEFEYDDLVERSVEINGRHLDHASLISVTSSSDDFDVKYTQGDTSFTVVPANENTSGDDYKATVTVTVDGESQTLSLSQKYEGKAAPAEFYGLSTDYYEFACDETDAQTVTLVGNYFDSAKVLTVDVDSSDFTVSQPADSGDGVYQFTVAPAKENSTDTVYSGTVTVTVDEAVYTMSVLQIGAELNKISVSVDDFVTANFNPAEDLIFDNLSFDWKTAFRDSDAAIIMYGGGSLTIKALDSATIIAVDITFKDSNYDDYLSSNVGSYSSGAWTGSASSVTFTSNNTTSGIVNIAVTMLKDGVPTVYVEPVVLTIPAEGGSVTAEITMYNTESVDITGSGSYFTPSITGSTLTVTASANTTGKAKTDYIYVMPTGGANGSDVEIQVTQAAN